MRFFIATFFCSLSSISLQPSCICPLQHLEIMETTPIEASSSTAPAVPLSGQKRPQEPSPDNPVIFKEIADEEVYQAQEEEEKVGSVQVD